jgi:hypothetical protein
MRFRRLIVVAMQPFVDGSPLVWDAKLGAQIATARRDLAR